MNKFLRWSGVFIVTLVVSVIGSALVFTTGLFVQEVVVFPLTVLVMGLLAALSSSWMSNFFGGGTTHSRLLRIVAVTEVVSFLIVLLPGAWGFYAMRYGPNILLVATWGVAVSVIACLVASRFRSPVYRKRQDIIVSFVLLALAPVVVVVTIAIASRFGLTGA